MVSVAMASFKPFEINAKAFIAQNFLFGLGGHLSISENESIEESVIRSENNVEKRFVAGSRLGIHQAA